MKVSGLFLRLCVFVDMGLASKIKLHLINKAGAHFPLYNFIIRTNFSN